MKKIEYLRPSYDFIDDGADDLMLVMDACEGTADDENAQFIYDGKSEAMLIRSNGQIVYLPIVAEPVREMLTDGRTILLVTEMDGDDIDDVYEAQLTVTNEPLPIPQEVKTRGAWRPNK